MNPLTATRPRAPVDGSILATSVTCTDDQSTAVPSARPKQNAISPSSHASRGSGVRTPSWWCSIRSPTGTNRKTTTSPTKPNAHNEPRAGPMTEPPGRSKARAISTIMPAPKRLPMLKNAWNRLITGFGRTFSTWTPREFIATSIAPLPRPASTIATIASGSDCATERVPMATTSITAVNSATGRAPILSASRPPICMDSTAETATHNSSREMPFASMPRRSRKAGSAPPIPPRIVPLMANNAPTATAADWVDKGLRASVDAVMRGVSPPRPRGTPRARPDRRPRP